MLVGPYVIHCLRLGALLMTGLHCGVFLAPTYKKGKGRERTYLSTPKIDDSYPAVSSPWRSPFIVCIILYDISHEALFPCVFVTDLFPWKPYAGVIYQLSMYSTAFLLRNKNCYFLTLKCCCGVLKRSCFATPGRETNIRHHSYELGPVRPAMSLEGN